MNHCEFARRDAGEVFLVIVARYDSDANSERCKQLATSRRRACKGYGAQNSPCSYDALIIKCARAKILACKRKLLAVSLVLNFDIAVGMTAARVAMGPMNDAAARIELVFTAHANGRTGRNGQRTGEIDVRFDANREPASARPAEVQKKALVRARAARFYAEIARNNAACGHLDMRATRPPGVVHGGICIAAWGLAARRKPREQPACGEKPTQRRSAGRPRAVRHARRAGGCRRRRRRRADARNGCSCWPSQTYTRRSCTRRRGRRSPAHPEARR